MQSACKPDWGGATPWGRGASDALIHAEGPGVRSAREAPGMLPFKTGPQGSWRIPARSRAPATT